jgi:peptide deformylase
MRLRTATVLALFLALGACAADGDDDRDSGSDAGADVAPADSSADADADSAEADAEPPEADVDEDEGTSACPPLTTEEVDLILAAGADQVLDIVTNETPEGDAFLHERSPCVDPLDPTVVHLVSRMRRTLASSLGGVGLAAPQVGIHRRIFLAQRTDQTGRPVQAFLNPQIVEYGTERGATTEGCLSIPGASPSVERPLSVLIDHEREDGTFVAAEFIGGARATQAAYAARIVQHEYDHLEGILIVDPR